MSSGEIVHALTFDVEDWYQSFVYRGVTGWERFGSRERQNIATVLGLLREFNTKATFFVLGSFAERHRDVVRMIVEDGHEIASHGYAHKPIPQLSRNEFREDLVRSMAELTDITGRRIGGHRAARWSLGKDQLWAFEVMAEAGLVYDSSVFPTQCHSPGLPGSPTHAYQVRLDSGSSLYEFPAQVLRIGPARLPAAGGFYFRAFPYSVSRWALRQSDAARWSGMVYLHPYDLDTESPRLSVSPMHWLVRYYRLHKTAPYLRRLLADFRFVTVSELLEKKKASIPEVPISHLASKGADRDVRQGR